MHAFAIDEEVVYTEVNSQAMLMSIEAGKYYSLSPVGTRIWQLLETPRTLETIVETLLEEFDVTPDECRADVKEFIGQLEVRRLVRSI